MSEQTVDRYAKEKPMITKVLLLLALSVNASWSAACNLDLTNHFGPHDYYDPANRGYNINVVTRRHLTPSMLMLEGGSTGTIAGDLDYTLAAIPNHPKALDLASRLEMAVEEGKKPKNEKLKRDTDCYFSRAVKLNPNIGQTYYVWGLHLQRKKAYSDAAEKYDTAEKLGMRSPEFYYNYGLLEFARQNYDLAKEKADKAYLRNFPLKGLRDKLKEKGYYQ